MSRHSVPNPSPDAEGDGAPANPRVLSEHSAGRPDDSVPRAPASADPVGASAEESRALIRRLEDNIASVVLGRGEAVRLTLTALLAGEHILLEDVPGVGKTLMGKAVARSVDGEFRRVQFTPDLLPADILGSSVFHARDSEFVFHRGPLFANIVLADEINRAPPRTQSALLEAMSDRQVSVDGETHQLPEPFMVIATQNPFEFEGTYALPESQLDRFLLRISVGYPSREQQRRVLLHHRDGEPVDRLRPVVSCEQVASLQAAARQVRVDDAINEYILDIVEATRGRSDLLVGVSMRGGLSLYRAVQALALIDGRDFVSPDDVKRLAVPAFAHRILTQGYQQHGRRDTTERLIQEVLRQVAAPR